MKYIKNTLFSAMLAAAGSTLLFSAQTAMAEQPAAVSGVGTLSNAARVDFQITIPRFLRFRVGAAGGTIDLIQFAPTAEQVGDGTPLAGTGGTPGPGSVDVQVRSNAGQINITAAPAVAAGLNDGGANTIAYTEITTATSAGTVPAPTLINGTSAPAAVTLNAGNVTNRNAVWTYSYANSTIPEAGTYGGVNIRNGRVTYTASSP
jgi:hypothetical protein